MKIRLVTLLAPEQLSPLDLTIGKVYETDGELSDDPQFGKFYDIVDDAGIDNILYTEEVEVVEE